MRIKDIRLIEIELHSQCNRKCKWCPNAYIDRTFYKELPESIFEKLIDELARNRYKNYISFSRYNEPLMHRPLLEKRIAYIRDKLPGATLVMNTNGDFNYEGIDIDELTVMDYDGKKEPIVKDDFRIMKLRHLNNRGGALKQIKADKRTDPCLEPHYFVGVDYTGDVTPCCNIRHDVWKHKRWILGNLQNRTLNDILNGMTAMSFRVMTAAGHFNGLPCEYCTKKPGRYTRDKPDIGGKQT